MKKLLLFSAVLFCIKSNAQVINLSGNSTTVSIYDQTDVEFKLTTSIGKINTSMVNTPQGSFVKLLIDSYGASGTFGFPQLPALIKKIEIPQDASVVVDVISFDSEIIDLNALGIINKIIPNQPSLSKSKKIKEVVFQYNNLAYQTSQFIKYDIAKVDVIGQSRSIRLGKLTVCPFEYNPVTNQLIVYNNLKLKVSFKNADLIKTAAIKEQYLSPAFANEQYNTLNKLQTFTTRDQLVTYPVTYVIVAPNSYASALQPLVKWKTKKGFKVIEAYTNNPQVGNTSASIKNYLQNLYANATVANPAPSYLLIVGDIAQVPSFTGVTDPAHKTDLYYCEYTGDYLPELYYGRFSATSLAHVTTQVNKTLEYEQFLFPDPSFLNNMVLISGVDPSMAPTYGNGQINYAENNYVNTAHGVTAYTYLYPQSIGADASIIADVNAGCSFVNYTAHGYEYGFADPAFEVTDIATLSNAHKYPLIIGNCCLTNSFNMPECFGEALLRANNKGAIGYIGGSNVTYWDEDYWWAVGAGAISANPTYSQTGLGAYDCLYHENGEADTDWYVTNGQMIYAGNMAVIDAGGSDSYYWEIYHLMGDPSLMTYMGVPSNLSVSHNISDLPGTSSLTVNAEPYAYVAISLNGVLLDAKLAGSSGIVTLNFAPITTTSVLDVVVTKQNKVPYIGTYTVTNAIGINEEIIENSLVISNPVENNQLNVWVNSNSENNSHIQICSVDGKLVYSNNMELKKGKNQYQINLNELANGTYSFRLISNDKVINKLFVINKN